MTTTSSPDVREQLSAMMDGELPRDSLRFVLKRCEGDDTLGQSWQRWHLAGDVMRGGKPVPVRIDLVRAVAMAIEQETRQSSSFGRSALRWGGGFAVAASVALVALLSVQPAGMPESTLVANVPAAAPANLGVATVAPSTLREQDLRPPYRLDVQTVSDEGMPYGTMRFDPRIENYLLQRAAAQRTSGQAASYVLRRPAATDASRAREAAAVREPATVE